MPALVQSLLVTSLMQWCAMVIEYDHKTIPGCVCVVLTSHGRCSMQAIPENRRRVAVTRGLCIARRNRGIRTTFTIRNHLGTAGGIERTFPL